MSNNNNEVFIADDNNNAMVEEGTRTDKVSGKGVQAEVVVIENAALIQDGPIDSNRAIDVNDGTAIKGVSRKRKRDAIQDVGPINDATHPINDVDAINGAIQDESSVDGTKGVAKGVKERADHGNDSVRSLLSSRGMNQCGLCSGTFYPPIVQCVNGHVVCHSCLPQLEDQKCRKCRVPVNAANYSRCLVLENLLGSELRKCRVSCGATSVPFREILAHEQKCIARIQKRMLYCPSKQCSHFRGTPDQLREHLVAKHNCAVGQSDKATIQITRHSPSFSGEPMWLLNIEGREYVVMATSIANGTLIQLRLFSIQRMDEEDDARSKYTAIMLVVQHKDHRSSTVGSFLPRQCSLRVNPRSSSFSHQSTVFVKMSHVFCHGASSDIHSRSLRRAIFDTDPKQQMYHFFASIHTSTM